MTHALTRAGTIGPLATIVEASGVSIARLLRAADLPVVLLERPDNLILLRDQFRLIETAARMTGDDVLPLRLSIASGLDGLGPYGYHLISFPDLKAAIIQGYEAYAYQLQASTTMDLRFDKKFAIWSYYVTAPLTVGRQKNELLALGYMLQILRWFLGSEWAPLYATLPQPVTNKRKAEELLSCSIERGVLASIVFSTDLLSRPAPPHKQSDGWVVARVPSSNEVASVVQHMIILERFTDRYGIGAIANRMGMTIRSLQRRLSEERNSFENIKRQTDYVYAIDLLRKRQLSITEIAHIIGYSDLAHFTRAFKKWTGLSPSRWQRSGS